MKPVTETLIQTVPAPIEKVFAALTDPARIPRWLPACTAAQASGPLKRGGLLRVRFGAERDVTLEIIDYKAPYTFGWVERDGRHGAKTFFRLDVANGATAVTVREQWQAPGWLAWVRAKFADKRRSGMHLDRALEGLRASVAVEAPSV